MLNELLAQAKARWESMSDAERRDMVRKQAKSWVRAEASWPKPRFKMIEGVKVYESYADYCNG